MPAYTGELIALCTLTCWAFGSHCFEAAGHRVGSMAVNFLRLILALLMFCVLLWIRTSSPFPIGFSAVQWNWLLFSGVVGFAFGDMCLFRAFVEIGPRVSLLLMTINAPLSAVMGWLWLQEEYGPLQWLGMLITLIGITWVILERPAFDVSEGSNTSRKVRHITTRGILLGLGGAIGQAVGGVTSKYALELQSGSDAFAATQIRVLGGIAGLIFVFLVIRWWLPTYNAIKDGRGMFWMTCGAFLGPFLGVSLYLRAMQFTTVGVVATIVALLPVAVIPLAMIIHKEHISPRAFGGALIAFMGVVLLVFE